MEILNCFSEPVKKLFSSLNQFAILQVALAVSIYYFVMNSMVEIILGNKYLQQNVYTKPILKYNDLVLKFLRDAEILWIVLIFILIISSVVAVIVSCVFFSDYIFLFRSSKYGADLGIWLGYIYSNYKLFMLAGKYYMCIVLLICFLWYWIKEIKKKRKQVGQS